MTHTFSGPSGVGPFATAESDPITVRWRWYESFPSVYTWGVLLVLLIAVPSNRNWRAWLVLLLPGVVVAIFQTIAVFDEQGVTAGRGVDLFIFSIAAAWSGVWLLAPWIRREGRIPTLLQMLVVLGCFAILEYFTFCGFRWCEATEMLLVYWPILAISPWIAATVASLCCRRTYRLWKLLLATAVCTPIVVAFEIIAFLCYISYAMSPSDFSRSDWAMQFVFGVAFNSVFILLMSLPILALLAVSRFHRERCRLLFERETDETRNGSP